MSPITSLIITQVHSSAEYIADTFREKGIATVIRILLLPYSLVLKNSEEQGSVAFIDIHEWHDTELAYETVSDLNRGNVVNLVHNTSDDSWAIARNLYRCLTQDISQLPYITHFNVDANQDYDDDYENENVHENEQWRGVNLETIFQMEI